MSGSLVPSASIRRRMISIDCSTARAAVASKAAWEKLRRIVWFGPWSMFTS